MTHSFPTRRSSDLEIKWHVACGLVPSTFLKQLLDVPLQPAISLATNFGYSQQAKRQGHGLPHLSARHAHQLQAASAQITYDAICMRDGRQDAAGSGLRLILTGEQINLQSERPSPANEPGAVA